MIKLENVQKQQAGKSTLSQKCTVFPNFPFHSKTSERINCSSIKPTSFLQAYPIRQVRAVMSRLGNSLLQQAREKEISVTLSYLSHYTPCAIRAGGKWAVGSVFLWMSLVGKAHPWHSIYLFTHDKSSLPHCDPLHLDFLPAFKPQLIRRFTTPYDSWLSQFLISLCSSLLPKWIGIFHLVC